MQRNRTMRFKNLGVLAMLSVVALVGELRPAVSETVDTSRTVSPASNTRGMAIEPAQPVASRLRVTALASEADALAARASSEQALAAAIAAEKQDEVTLVPAIYAWDPDVRFVYFRQVSKWM